MEDWKAAYKRSAVLAVALGGFLIATGYAAETGRPGRSITVGTFNIRNFPCNNNCRCLKAHGFDCRRDRDAPPTSLSLLADEIRRLRVDILAVNEILSPRRMNRFAHDFLGPDRRFVWAQEGGAQKVGFLYDGSTVRLVEKLEFTQLYSSVKAENHPSKCVRGLRDLRPALVCRFAVRDSAMDFYAVAVHLKSGPCDSVRKAQWDSMISLATRLSERDPDIIVLGDFNDFDRTQDDAAQFRRRSGFALLTKSVPCTLIAKKRGLVLDNLLVSPSMLGWCVTGSVRVGGACDEGCRPSRSTRKYVRRVSDHCPVTAVFLPAAGRGERGGRGEPRVRPTRPTPSHGIDGQNDRGAVIPAIPTCRASVWALMSPRFPSLPRVSQALPSLRGDPSEAFVAPLRPPPRGSLDLNLPCSAP